MTIQEAINSGKPFKRRSWIYALQLDWEGMLRFGDSEGTLYRPVSTDLVAIDWEIQREKVTLEFTPLPGNWNVSFGSTSNAEVRVRLTPEEAGKLQQLTLNTLKVVIEGVK